MVAGRLLKIRLPYAGESRLFLLCLGPDEVVVVAAVDRLEAFSSRTMVFWEQLRGSVSKNLANEYH